MTEERKVIDETNYSYQMPKAFGPSVVGKGGDPLFMNVRATKAQLEELLDETTTVQDWIQRETCNNVALACLDNENLKIAFLLVDSKVGPTNDDVLMFEYLKYYNIKVKVIGTKCDKVGSTLVLKQKKMIYTKLNISPDDVIMTSSESKKGINEIHNLLI